MVGVDPDGAGAQAVGERQRLVEVRRVNGRRQTVRRVVRALDRLYQVGN